MISLCRDLGNKAHGVRKEKSLNIRKSIDYSVISVGFDQALERNLP